MVAASEIIDGQKRCGKCHQWKPISEFHLSTKAVTGLASRCKACISENKKADLRRRPYDPETARVYSRRYKDRFPERVAIGERRRNLRRKFGVTPEWYDEKLAEQGGVCAGCKQPETVRKYLAVDHDHETGEVRGLLCQSCNTALGLMRESVERMQSLIAYLEKYQRGIT